MSLKRSVSKSKRRRTSSNLLNKEQKLSTWATLETEKKSLKICPLISQKKRPKMKNDLILTIFYCMYGKKEL